jgi:hypothetical protein
MSNHIVGKFVVDAESLAGKVSRRMGNLLGKYRNMQIDTRMFPGKFSWPTGKIKSALGKFGSMPGKFGLMLGKFGLMLGKFSYVLGNPCVH